MARDFFGRPLESKGPAVELPRAVDLPWRVPKPRPVALWCRGESKGPWWVKCAPSTPLWCRGHWDYSPWWIRKQEARPRYRPWD